MYFVRTRTYIWYVPGTYRQAPPQAFIMNHEKMDGILHTVLYCMYRTGLGQAV